MAFQALADTTVHSNEIERRSDGLSSFSDTTVPSNKIERISKGRERIVKNHKEK
jgi:hypothetical protein